MAPNFSWFESCVLGVALMELSLFHHLDHLESSRYEPEVE